MAKVHGSFMIEQEVMDKVENVNLKKLLARNVFVRK